MTTYSVTDHYLFKSDGSKYYPQSDLVAHFESEQEAKEACDLLNKYSELEALCQDMNKCLGVLTEMEDDPNISALCERFRSVRDSYREANSCLSRYSALTNPTKTPTTAS